LTSIYNIHCIWWPKSIIESRHNNNNNKTSIPLTTKWHLSALVRGSLCRVRFVSTSWNLSPARSTLVGPLLHLSAKNGRLYWRRRATKSSRSGLLVLANSNPWSRGGRGTSFAISGSTLSCGDTVPDAAANEARG
jgi:hypothetical protein